MRIVIFGLSVSSSWGNGHATLWRGLIRALDEAGTLVEFFERDVPHHRSHRDLRVLPGRARLHLYDRWDPTFEQARAAVDEADAAIVTSHCPDGRRACDLVLGSKARCRVFYDLDTPLTLEQLACGVDVPYLPREGLGAFDLVLSYTGGRSLFALRERLSARRVAALHGSADAHVHRPTKPAWSSACSYLGTWSEDRQSSLDALFLEPARRRPKLRFVLGGSRYPESIEFPHNVTRVEHVAPAAHSAFYASSPLTVSVTRKPMARIGYCPSARMFEAAACGVPVLSDAWEGIGDFFAPGEEILLARSSDDAVAAIERPREQLAAIGERARDRVLAEHTSSRRAAQLVELLS